VGKGPTTKPLPAKGKQTRKTGGPPSKPGKWGKTYEPDGLKEREGTEGRRSLHPAEKNTAGQENELQQKTRAERCAL